MGKEGEGTLLLKQIHEISREVFDNVADLDKKLKRVQTLLESDMDIDREALLAQIKEMRLITGSIEEEDSEEMKDEEILENMMKKLNNLIEMTLGGN